MIDITETTGKFDVVFRGDIIGQVKTNECLVDFGIKIRNTSYHVTKQTKTKVYVILDED